MPEIGSEYLSQLYEDARRAPRDPVSQEEFAAYVDLMRSMAHAGATSSAVVLERKTAVVIRALIDRLRFGRPASAQYVFVKQERPTHIHEPEDEV